MRKYLTVLLCLFQLIALRSVSAAPALKPPRKMPDGTLRYYYEITDLPAIVRSIETKCAEDFRNKIESLAVSSAQIIESKLSNSEKLEKLLKLRSQDLMKSTSTETLRLADQSYRLIMATTVTSLEANHLSTNTRQDVLSAMLSLGQLLTYRTHQCLLSGPVSGYSIATSNRDNDRPANIFRKVLELSALHNEDTTFDYSTLSSLAAILDPEELDSLGNQLIMRFGVNKRMLTPYRLIAEEHEKSERWKLALKWYSRVLSIPESKTADRTKYLADLNSLAKCQYAEKQYSQSFKTYKRFLEEINTTFGADSLQAIQYRKALAMLLHKHHLDSEAEQLFLDAIKSCKGEANCYAHVELGKFYATVGRLDEAQRQFTQELTSFKKSGLLDTDDGARFVAHFVKLLDRRGETDKAELLLQNSFSVLAHENDALASEAIDLYADCYSSRGLYYLAHRLESRSLDRRIKLYGTADTLTRSARNKVAMMLLKQNKFDQGDRLYMTALKEIERTSKDSFNRIDIVRDRVYFRGLAKRPIAPLLEAEVTRHDCYFNSFARDLICDYLKRGLDEKIITLAQTLNLESQREHMYDAGLYVPYLAALTRSGRTDKAIRVADLGIADSIYFLSRFETLHTNTVTEILIEEVRLFEESDKSKLPSLLNSIVLLCRTRNPILMPDQIDYLKKVLAKEGRSNEAKEIEGAHRDISFISQEPVPHELNFEHNECDTFFSSSALPGFID